MPEAVGDAGLLFDPHDVEALLDRITAVLENQTQAAKMREQGLIQAKRFSWKMAGEQTAAVYARALGM